MKNQNPAGRKLHMANTWQRVFSVVFLAFFAYLIWLALSGRYDHDINALAAWLHEIWGDIRQIFR